MLNTFLLSSQETPHMHMMSSVLEIAYVHYANPVRIKDCGVRGGSIYIYIICIE